MRTICSAPTSPATTRTVSGMLPDYVRMLHAGLLVPNQELKPLRDAGAVLVLDAGRGFGQAVAKEAMRRGAGRAKELGAVVLALRNSAHVGRVGTYGEQCAAMGLASIHFVNVGDHMPHQAPYGCGDARLGTNPFCVAMPDGKGGASWCSTWRPAPSPSARPGWRATRACRCRPTR